jgi:membrane fusion protein, copper/silver efflux system
MKSFIFLVLSLLLLLGLSACSKKVAQQGGGDADYYTCAMHPSVRSKDFGKCPICSMDLVPVAKKDGGATAGGHMHPSVETPGAPPTAAPQKPREFTVPVERQQMIGVTYATVERRPLEATLRTVGIVEPETQRLFEYVSRVDGYVDKLAVSSPGQIIKKGESLLTIYSPDLLATEQELLEMLRTSGGSDRLVESAKRRLKLWNVSDEEIDQLLKTRKASEFLTLRSPFDGVVQNVAVKPGINVKVGDRLMGLVDLSAVWLWAEFYENELPLLRIGQRIKITVPAFGNEEFGGEIAVMEPFLDPIKRTVRVRIDIPNAQWKLRPGMFVNAWLDVRAGEGLTVPISAVMPTGNRNLVFVDKGEGRLEPRFVELGGKFSKLGPGYDSDYYEVRGGLQEGERVVGSANFLIDAESKIQGALKTWAAEDAATEQPAPTGAKASQTVPLPPKAAALYEPLLNAYFSIQRTLAKDQMDGVAASADTFRNQIEALLDSDVKPLSEVDAYQEHLKALQASAAKFQPKDIEEARVQFGELSSDLIALLSQFRPPLGQTLYTIHCPMWEKSPSRWLQTTNEVENPFMGEAMASCGEVVNTMEAPK